MEPELYPDCAAWADLLVDYSDDELAPSERLRVEAHLAQCGACRAQLRKLDASLAQLTTAATLRTPARCSPVRSGARTYVAAAASLAALLLASWGIWQMTKAPRTIIDGHAAALPARELLSQAAALRRIVFIEQRARLQAAMETIPDDPWFASQRTENEHLLSTFQRAADETTTPSTPKAGEAL